MNNKSVTELAELKENKLDFLIDVEQKRTAYLNKSFGETKNRVLLIVSAEFAIFTFFFSDLASLIPNELYGIIFSSIGILAGIASMALLFCHLTPIEWPDPIGPVEEVKIDMAESNLAWKQVALSDYRAANTRCGEILERRAKALKWSLILFVISVIILLIIKFF